MSTQPTTEAPAVAVTVHPSRRGGGELGEPLAHGILTSAETVLVPDPPEALASPWKRYLVRISRSPGDGKDSQVVLSGGLSLSAVNGDGITAAAAVLSLISPSRFGVRVERVTPARLAESLVRHHGDQWAVYAELGFGVVRPEGLAPPEKWWLDALTADGDVSSGAEEYEERTCCSSRTCSPCI
ncbi:hypothetical protein ACWC5I_11110 [Kitasatospora sp. NPDC001574]